MNIGCTLIKIKERYTKYMTILYYKQKLVLQGLSVSIQQKKKSYKTSILLFPKSLYRGFETILMNV